MFKFVILSLLFFAPQTFADDATREELARKIINLEAGEAEAMFANLDKQVMLKVEAEQNEEKREYLKAIFSEGVFNQEDLEELKNIVVKIYVAKFSESELEYLYKFKKSSTNKKLSEIDQEKEKFITPFVFSVMSRKFKAASENFNQE